MGLEVRGHHGHRGAVDGDGGGERAAAHLVGDGVVVPHRIPHLDGPDLFGQGADPGRVLEGAGGQQGDAYAAAVGIAELGVRQVMRERAADVLKRLGWPDLLECEDVGGTSSSSTLLRRRRSWRSTSATRRMTLPVRSSSSALASWSSRCRRRSRRRTRHPPRRRRACSPTTGRGPSDTRRGPRQRTSPFDGRVEVLRGRR